MNDDLVRRDDILKLKRTLYRVRYGTGYQSIEDTEAVEVDDIESIPAVDVRPVVWGKWEYIGGYGYQYRCSNCIKCVERKTVYCPNCGADMRGTNR